MSILDDIARISYQYLLEKEKKDELIVDSQHFELVKELLAGIKGVAWPTAKAEEAPELGLVLLTKIDLTAYAAGARQLYAAEIAKREADVAPTLPKEVSAELSDLDVLLIDVRKRFREKYGYEVIVGKNRDSMVGYPQHQATPKHPELFTGAFGVDADKAGAGVSIGVVDTPLSPHDLLPADRVQWERDLEFHGDGTLKLPWVGHATFVSGRIRAEAAGADIEVRACLDEGNGVCTGWKAARTIAKFATAGLDILNLSLGCVTKDSDAPLLMQRAVQKVAERGTLVVASAGNRAQDGFTHVWPAAEPPVVAVGTHMDDDFKAADFSMKQKWVDCTAEGFDVPGPFPVGSVITGNVSQDDIGLAKWSGTSFSSGTVTGKIAKRMTRDDLPAQAAFDALLTDPDSGVRPGFGAVSGS